MKQFDKQFKYSIRKVSVGAASVVIGAFYLAMGAGVVHAETNATTEGGTSHSSSSPEPEINKPDSLPTSSYSAEPAPNPATLLAGVAHSVKEETETKTVTRIIKYVDASDESKEVATPVTQTVTLTRKKGTEEWTRGKWAAQTSPTVEGYNAPDKSIVEAKDVTSSTEDEEVLVYYTNTSSSDETIRQRGRRSKRDVSTAETGTSTENNEALNSAVTGRRGSILQPNQPGVSAPKEGEEGGDDQHAHLKFVAPDENATVEELYKIIQNMPDDFQNNERSYLHNMDTLGDKVGLEPGEVREITEFGGWHAIDKDGHKGKIGIGKKNEAGLFTGWYYDKDGNKIQGGMLSAGAMDEIWVHEQALDRRFKYMLMLAKGRTFANRDEEVKNGSKYTTENPYTSRPTYSPNVVGFNGIEKRFTAFSTAYGSRLKLDFVTGYIGSSFHTRGVYRVVVKAIKKDKADPQNEREIEETIYDHTINEVDGVVDNKELKNRGVDIRGINEWLHTKFKIEYKSRVLKEVKKRMVAYSGLGEKEKAEKKEEINKQVEEELKDSVSWEITKEFFTEMFKKPTKTHFAGQIVNMLYQSGNGALKNFLRVDHSPENPIRKDKELDKKPDKFYQLWHYLFPTAKKITYHGDVDQLEIETDATEVLKELKTKLEQKENDLKTATDESQRTALQKEIEELKAKMSTTHSYTYREARDGKVGKPIGSDIEILPEVQPLTKMSVDEFNKFSKNRKAFYEPKGEETFDNLLPYDKFRRTNVLTDEEMSEKIKEVVKNDENNFGRGGYFSTGDIPLDKDVIAYKVAVFSGDDDHVGVLRNTHRVSYNLPILADFSVIQDTTEPSKEVARRIIDKMIKEKKIPEETGNKLKKELEKVKKTSEIRNKFFGNVAVKYVDTDGHLLSPKDDKKLGEKSADGTYLVQNGSLVESEYDVTSSKLANITTADNKYYTLRSSVNEGWDSTSDSPTGTVTTKPKVVTFVYEESTPPVKGKGVVHFKKQVSEAATEALAGYGDITLEGDVGTEFSAEEVNTKITELKNAGYEIVEDTFTSGNKTIDSTTDVDGQEPSQVYDVVVKETVADEVETKTITRTIKYVDKENEATAVADTVTQAVELTRTNKRNKVTNLLTEGTWSTAKWEAKTSPTVANYDTPDKENVEETTVTSTTSDTTVVVKYPQTVADEVETKTITRTIKYVDKENEATAVADTITQAVELTRTNKRNKVTKVVTEGTWSTGNWDSKDSPAVENYGPAETATVASAEVTSTTQDTTVVVKYPQATEDVEETKTITRTIKYVDKENEAQEVATRVTQTVTLTRTNKRNKVTKVVTEGTWSTAKWEAQTSPVVKGYILKDAKQKEVASATVKSDTKDETITVVYTKVGLFIPKVPEGVTPKTPLTPTPYDNDPEDPSKVVTPNPEKPKDPKDPNSPKVPVIPQVPGYTPVVPKDPTKPVSPENPLIPLTPVDPNHPEKGYNVPPVPTTPGQDTPITYVKDGQQKAITSFVDPKGNVLETPITETGDSNTPLTKDGEVATAIAKLKAKGYDVVSNDYPSKGTFDNDPKVDQYFNVVLTPHIEPVKPFDPTQPENPDNPKPEPGTPIDPNNPEGPKWTEALIKQLVTKKEVSRTITYVDEDGNRLTYTANDKETTLPVINKATFTRGARVNAVTGEVTHDTTWIAEGEKFEKVISPVVPGYILKDTNQKEVASETVDQDTEDKAIEVFYKKLGSWVPRIPEGVTPPPGTDLTPKPYPNDPTDPTRPGTDKPRVPTIPGYTPMVPTDPTRPVSPTNPLKPLELTPNGGYEVPNLPTDPSKDIPITYVKDGQKVIVNFVDDKGNVVAPTILESGNSGEKFTKAGLVSSTIEELKAKGYTVESSTYPEEKDRIFDKDSTVDQVYTVTVKPNPDTPKQKAVIKFVVVGEDGKETELVTSRITTTGITGQTIPTNAFTEELKKLTGNPVNNGDYELIDNPLKDGAIFDKEKDEEGKDPSQIFTVKLRQIYVIPPTPRIIERSGGNNTVEVRVPNKDADTLFIKYTEKGKTSHDPKKEIITKKDETGKWKIDKKPEGVEISIDSETGVVSIPSEKIQPKTLVDTQTKHKYKFSKVVSVMPNISDVTEFKGITVWVDESGKELKPQVEGVHKKEDIKGYESKFVGYEWKESVLEGNKVTHIFKKVSNPTPYTPGEPTPENPTPQPNPEYPSVPTPSPELPNQPEPTPEPETPVSPDPEVPTYETGKREELPNTGTEANAGLASAGIMTLLAGLGLGFFKKKEDEK